jgi:beta-N-acetylhexosaminidase
MRKALISGLAGHHLGARERHFLAEVKPAGLILFSRNCESHDQIKRLIAESLEAIGSANTLVLIDQEGGRVQRLRPPLGRMLPSARAFGMHFEQDAKAADHAARLVFRLLAADLRALGINCDCVPVLDLPVPGAHGVIGDRAYAQSPEPVVAMGRAVAEGLIGGGVVPVIKHVPGHGRAKCDSHFQLPVVKESLEELQASDFVPFRELASLPAAMTAHVVYNAIDPAAPATTSPPVVAEVIRGHIGFQGLLMSDDLSMKALKGSLRCRAEAAIAAGCDLVLHCNGEFAEMEAVAAGSPDLSSAAAQRFDTALGVTHSAEDFDIDAAEAALERVLAISSV